MNTLSLNQKTVNSWSLREAIDGCASAGIESIGVWREPLADIGVHQAAQLIDAAGLRVSSLCRGGFFTSDDPATYRAAIADNVAAIREAASLGSACLILVAGGLPPGSKNLAGARARVGDAVAELAPVAQAEGVTLAIEPMNPIFTADRGVIATLAEALDIAEQFPARNVGVVIDTFHVWWDPQLEAQIARAGTGDRIVAYQVCDWITPLPADTLLSRGMMGDGHIDFRRISNLVASAGYRGDTEVEIFNADVWAEDPKVVLDTVQHRFTAHVSVP
jgi:sugar phosphate isomerase/epimerase